MASTNKIASNAIENIRPGRIEASRVGHKGREAFARRLSDESSRSIDESRSSSVEQQAAQRYLFDDAWARERTREELTTLVGAIRSGVTDTWQLTDLLFYRRHPELVGVPLTTEQQGFLDEWNAISALLVHPALTEFGSLLGSDFSETRGSDLHETQHAPESFRPFDQARGRAADASDRFDEVIADAVDWCPGLSPAMLKSLLAQESNFDTRVINRYGYAGIAQFGRAAAREVGLHVGVAGSASDERLDPHRAIPAAARLLNIKAQRLSESAFARYGKPGGVEFWKFVVAAYNGGEGTVTVAMGHAYRSGLARARALGLVGTDAVAYAREHASKWENLKIGGAHSPLALAAARFFPNLATAKYHEIGNYPTQIVARAIGGTG